jgi:DNA repair protein RadA/Sms
MTTGTYSCLQCGHRTHQWLGRCPECAAWDSFAKTQGEKGGAVCQPAPQPIAISSVPVEVRQRIATGLGEFDRVLGGGAVPGSVVLMAGEPGIGKSTLMLQVAGEVERRGKRVLYFCGEESPEQVASRARRLGAPGSVRLSEAVEVDQIAPLLEQADLAIIDSIQTLSDSSSAAEPGSVSQVRLSAAAIARAARSSHTAVVLVGHICKDGSIAGPRALEHLVDVVVGFEGDRAQVLRTVRGVKNRFGPTGELGVFEMHDTGLRQVPDASALFLAGRPEGVAGSAVGCVLEGRRPLALEVQTLIAEQTNGSPRRVAQGIEVARLGVALAVLDKRAGIALARNDVYCSVAGGFRAGEPAIDLPLLVALAGSGLGRATPPGLAFVGEVGLAGDLRAVAGIDARLKELGRLGYNRVVIPASHTGRHHSESQVPGVEVIGACTLKEALRLLEKGPAAA